MAKYNNPIRKPETVKLHMWEYEVLIDKSVKLDILMDLMAQDERYKAMDVLELFMKGAAKMAEVPEDDLTRQEPDGLVYPGTDIQIVPTAQVDGGEV